MEHSALFWIFNVAVVISVSALTIYCAITRKGSGQYLCDDCRFNNPTSCLKVERPTALNCTSYRQVFATAAGAVNAGPTPAPPASGADTMASATIIDDQETAQSASKTSADITQAEP